MCDTIFVDSIYVCYSAKMPETEFSPCVPSAEAPLDGVANVSKNFENIKFETFKSLPEYKAIDGWLSLIGLDKTVAMQVCTELVQKDSKNMLLLYPSKKINELTTTLENFTKSLADLLNTNDLRIDMIKDLDTALYTTIQKAYFLEISLLECHYIEGSKLGVLLELSNDTSFEEKVTTLQSELWYPPYSVNSSYEILANLSLSIRAIRKLSEISFEEVSGVADYFGVQFESGEFLSFQERLNEISNHQGVGEIGVIKKKEIDVLSQLVFPTTNDSEYDIFSNFALSNLQQLQNGKKLAIAQKIAESNPEKLSDLLIFYSNNRLRLIYKLLKSIGVEFSNQEQFRAVKTAKSTILTNGNTFTLGIPATVSVPKKLTTLLAHELTHIIKFVMSKGFALPKSQNYSDVEEGWCLILEAMASNYEYAKSEGKHSIIIALDSLGFSMKEIAVFVFFALKVERLQEADDKIKNSVYSLIHRNYRGMVSSVHTKNRAYLDGIELWKRIAQAYISEEVSQEIKNVISILLSPQIWYMTKCNPFDIEGFDWLIENINLFNTSESPNLLKPEHREYLKDPEIQNKYREFLSKIF